MGKKYFILALLFTSIYLFGNQPLVRNFTRDIYKSGTQNWAIAQDKYNRMFFANNNGLLEFDSKNWLTYPIDNGTNVRSLLYSTDNKFYASTFNDFGYYEEQKNGQFKYFSLTNKLDKKQISSNGLYYIHQGDNRIYFQAEKYIYEYKNDKIKYFPFYYKIDVSAFVNNALFVANEQKGVFMLNGNIFVKIPDSDILINKKVCSILPYLNNKTLFVTSFDGVYIFDGNSVVPFVTGFDDFLKKNQVFCAATNGEQLVFGTVQRGIVVKNVINGNITYVNTYSGLQNNTVLSVAFDNQQNLWLGLDKGIDYVLLNSPMLNIFGKNNLYGAGYTSLLKNNILYFGTNQGLYTSIYPLPNSSSPIQLQLIKGMEGQIWCLNEIDNTLFCGNDQGGFIVYPDHTEKISGLSGTWAFKLSKKYPDQIIGCSYLGLFILKKINGKWMFSHLIKGQFAESSPMFEEDTDGSIWFSHWQKGLFHLFLDNQMENITKVELYDQTKGFPSNRNNTVFRIGSQLIFSSERGFYLYNKKKDKMESYEKWNKLFKSSPNYIRLHESKNGDVWCVSGKFLGVAKHKSNNSYVMDSLTYQILQPKIIAGFENFNFLDNNNLILNTEDGFCWIDTRRENTIKKSFNVYLDRIYITNDKSYIIAGKRELLNGNRTNIYTNKQNSFRFEFIASDYRNDGLVKYSYMLENFDSEWSDFSVDNLKEYTQLPMGHYTFKVRARDILESKDAICTYSFVILPAWYQTKVAFVIYILVLCISIFWLVVFIDRKSKKGALDMEKQKEKELNEQKLLHEEETSAKKREIKELKNQQLQYELRHKSQELASSTMNLIRKNEILLEIMDNISKTTHELKANSDTSNILSRLNKMERNIRQNIENDNNWKKFEENFDLVYENYLKRLGELYPELNISDKKLCAYLKMDLSSKDIAPLLNMTVRSIEMNRYRLRKKMGLGRDVNLGEFLQRL